MAESEEMPYFVSDGVLDVVTLAGDRPTMVPVEDDVDVEQPTIAGIVVMEGDCGEIILEGAAEESRTDIWRREK